MWVIQEFNNAQSIGRLWDLFFGPMGMGAVPERLLFQHGAEFAVHKSRMLARPRSFYLQTLSFMIEVKDSGMMHTYEIAVAFERLWHVIFGESPEFGLDPDHHM